MIDSSKLPALNELKVNATNQTTQLSLRVKETTRALFEVEAQRCGLSTNSLIGELLDTYAENVIRREIGSNESKLQIIERYLENVAKKSSQLDTETLLREVVEQYHPGELFEGMYYEGSEPFEFAIDGKKVIIPPTVTDETQTFDVLIKDFAMWAEGRPTQYFKNSEPYFFVADGDVCAIPINLPSRVETEHLLPEDLQKFGLDQSSIYCYLRADYFVVFMSIILAYEAKLAELYPDHAGYLGEQTYRIIASFANIAKDRAEFASLVVKAILKSLKAQLPHAKVVATGSVPTVAEMLVMALEELGGSAHLSTLYTIYNRMLKEYRGGHNYKKMQVFQAAVRGALERCSKDCNPNTKQDYFSNPNKGEGYWRLNPGVHYDRNLQKIVIS